MQEIKFSRSYKSLLTKYRNLGRRLRSVKLDERIKLERRELPKSDWGIFILDCIKTLERILNK